MKTKKIPALDVHKILNEMATFEEAGVSEKI